jgi:putative transposase
VHLIVSIPPKHAVADVVHRLKGASSHDMGVQSVPFEWQRGYGCLTVGEKNRLLAQAYVEGQKTHHAQGSTMAALEYCAEVDEGPTSTGLVIDAVPPIVRDEHPAYTWITDWPF